MSFHLLTSERRYPLELVSKVNESLAHLPSDGIEKYPNKINVFKNPFLELSRDYLLPPTGMEGALEEYIPDYVAALGEIIPSFLSGCQLLPAAITERDKRQLVFIRHYQREERDYLFLFKAITNYMGGAVEAEVEVPGQSDVTAGVRTRKIYYESFLIPAENIEREDGNIVNFGTRSAAEIVRPWVQKIEKGMGREAVALLFDEPDFSEINEKITRLFGHRVMWRFGATYWPFVYKYRTIAVNLLRPVFGLVEKLIDPFHTDTNMIFENETLDRISSRTRKTWDRYFLNFSSRRTNSSLQGREDAVDWNSLAF